MGTTRALGGTWNKHRNEINRTISDVDVSWGTVWSNPFIVQLWKLRPREGLRQAWGYVINSLPPLVRDQLWQRRRFLWPLGIREEGLTQRQWWIAAMQTSPSSSQKVRSEASIPRFCAESIPRRGRKGPRPSKHVAFIHSHPALGGVKRHPKRDNSKETGS